MKGKISEVLYSKNVALAHTDERRTIFDPTKILVGLDGEWYHHNMIRLKEPNLFLGNHHHDYKETFFTPTGGINFALMDSSGESVVYHLEEGDRLFIPSYVNHTAVGQPGSVLIGYGSIEFDPKRLIACQPETKAQLEAILS